MQRLNPCALPPPFPDSWFFLPVVARFSGKTLAYLLPIFGQLLARSKKSGGASSADGDGKAHDASLPAAVVIVPTPELGMQVVRIINSLGAGLGISGALFAGKVAPPPVTVCLRR